MSVQRLRANKKLGLLLHSWPSGAISDEHQSARLSLPPEDTLLRTKDSTPGPDEVPITAIRPKVREAVCTHFSWCLELGWHPTPFRAATLVTIPKPGKGGDKQPSLIPAHCLTVDARERLGTIGRTTARVGSDPREDHPPTELRIPTVGSCSP